MITSRDLTRVVALADHGHFGRAAKALGITQPALSRSMEDLERRLGAKVFDRGRWGLAPTEAGELIIARGRLILQQSRDLQDEIDRLHGLEAGRLEITLGPYAAELSGHQSVARMLAKHDHIRCRVRVSDWREGRQGKTAEFQLFQPSLFRRLEKGDQVILRVGPGLFGWWYKGMQAVPAETGS